jgi:hypothetical protein
VTGRSSAGGPNLGASEARCRVGQRSAGDAGGGAAEPARPAALDRPADLPGEHGYLATEHDHLDDQVLAAEPREPDQLANAEEQEVEEPERHDAMLAALAFNKRGRDSRHRHVE